ncbi:MAG: endonuclease [Methylobacter sp.]|nr:MAG: endonuclease [Methylobacter sp.]
MKIINVSQRSPEWHHWRNSGVSASEADVVLGNSPYMTRFRLFAEKTGLILPDNLDRNPHVRRGVRIEPLARKSFEHRHGTLLLPLCGQSDEYPFLRASFDGIDDDGIPVEFKAPTERNFLDAKQNGRSSAVYQRYYSQVQQQIQVAGADKGWLSLYLNGSETIDFEIQRDDALIQTLVFEARQFIGCLANNLPPKKDPERDLFMPSGQDKVQWNALALAYHLLEDRIDGYKAKMAPLLKEQVTLEKQFLDLMGDYAEAETGGLRLSRYRQQGSIDYKAALQALVPDVDPLFLESFRRDSSERTRLTLKNEQTAQVPFSMESLLSANPHDGWF